MLRETTYLTQASDYDDDDGDDDDDDCKDSVQRKSRAVGFRRAYQGLLVAVRFHGFPGIHIVKLLRVMMLMM